MSISQYDVRNLGKDDFEALRRLDGELGDAGDALWPYYESTSFVATVAGRPAGYLLCFAHGDEAYLTQVRVLPEHERTPVVDEMVDALRAALAARRNKLARK